MKKEMRTIWGLLALVLVLAVAAAVVIVNTPAAAEESPDMTKYVWVKSEDGISLSTAPVELIPAEMLRISVDKKAIQEKEWLEADISLPYIPPSIQHIIVTDIWHGAFAVWQQTGEHTLHVKFWAGDLRAFATPEYCYLVILTEWQRP